MAQVAIRILREEGAIRRQALNRARARKCRESIQEIFALTTLGLVLVGTPHRLQKREVLREEKRVDQIVGEMSSPPMVSEKDFLIWLGTEVLSKGQGETIDPV